MSKTVNYTATVAVPEALMVEGTRVVTLSNRLSVVWTKSVEHLAIVFDGVVMGRVLNIVMEADAEKGMHWGVTLAQTPTYEQPADFLSELSHCGFAVNVKDYRSYNGS
jgi:hypothetical protein